MKLLTAHDYFLTTADYNLYPDISLYEKSIIALKQSKEMIQEYNEFNRTKEYPLCLYDCSHIVFWKNVPKSNIPNNTEDALFLAMCENTRTFRFGSFIIQNLDVLASGSTDTFIKRLCIMKNFYHWMPEFLDNTTSTLFDLHAHNANSLSFTETIQNIRRSEEEYTSLIGFLKNLYESVNGKLCSTEKNGFIHYYFEWQKGNIMVKDVLIKLGNMSKRTFYLYVNEFEHHPYYPEYCKLYFSDLIEKEKKGPHEIDWQDYYDDVAPLYKENALVTPITREDIDAIFYDTLLPTEDEIQHLLQQTKLDFNAFYQIKVDHICQKYDLASPIDVYRLLLTAKRKLKIK